MPAGGVKRQGTACARGRGEETGDCLCINVRTSAATIYHCHVFRAPSFEIVSVCILFLKRHDGCCYVGGGMVWEVLCGEGMVWGEFCVEVWDVACMYGGMVYCGKDNMGEGGGDGRAAFELCCFRGVATTYVSLGERQHLVLDLVAFSWSLRDY